MVAKEILEVWKPIPGYPNHQISNLGRVRSLDRVGKIKPGNHRKGRILTGTCDKGYIVVWLCHEGICEAFFVHRLVCTAFHGLSPSPKHQVCHSDGNRSNNRADNLRWGTKSDNEMDKVKHGKSNRGERHRSAKLTELKVKEVRKLLDQGIGMNEIASMFGVVPETIKAIKLRQSWGWLD